MRGDTCGKDDTLALHRAAGGLETRPDQDETLFVSHNSSLADWMTRSRTSAGIDDIAGLLSVYG